MSAPRLLIDEQNPWPGLGSFDEAAARFFNGRRQESIELRRLVLQAPLTVLFGKSGLGKTSLVQAGLFPLLRRDNVLPVYVRLDVRDRAAPLLDQVRRALVGDLQGHRVDALPAGAEESLWEYLHRSNVEFWSEQNQLLTPMLVFDQFEEVFTLGAENPEGIARLRIDLADLIENRIPAALGARIEQSETAAQGLALRTQRYKVLISFREDFLPAVEGWKRELPSIMRNRLRLLPMSGEQAFEAIHITAPHLVEEAVAREIVQFVAAAQEEGVATASATTESGALEVEPALLSLVCHGLNEKRKAQQKPTLDRALLRGAGQAIISDYYQRAVGDMPDRVQRFIENELITERGFRKPCDAGDARTVHGLTDSELRLLVDRRLLRIEPYQGSDRVELTHDLLTRVVREHRDRERERQRLRRQRRRMLLASSGGIALALVVAVLAVLTWFALDKAKQAASAEKLARDKAEQAASAAEDARGQAVEAERQKGLATESEKKALLAKKQAETALAVAEVEKRNAQTSATEARRQREAAEKSQGEALAAKGAADKAASEAESQRIIAEAAAKRAEEERRQAMARKLVAQAEAELDRGYEGLVRSSLLAIESIKAAWTPDAHELLVTQNALLPPRPVKVWKAHDTAVTALAANQRWLATESETGAAVWDMATWGLVAKLPDRHDQFFDDIALSDDARWLVAHCQGRGLCVWETGSWDAPKLQLGEYVMPGMRFSPDSRRLAVPSRGKSTVDIYETSDWKKVAELEHDSARATAWSADGRWLVTSTGSSMRLWDAEALERRAELEEGRIWSLSFDHRRPRLVGGIDGGYALWEIDQKEGGVVAFGPKQSRVVQSEGKSRIQGLRHEVAMSPDTAELATPSGIYALDSRQERSRMPPGIISLAFLPRGRKLVAGYPDGNVAVSTYDAQEMRRLDHERPVNSMAISPDTKWLATADEDGTARVFDMRTGLEERPIEQEVKVNSISFSPRGRWLVTIAGTTVRVFAVDGWRRVALIDHETTVQGLDFIRDDMRLVTRAGKVVQVVSLDTDVKSTPLLHSHAVRNAYVSGDGAWLQTVTVTGTVTSPVTRRGRRRGETTKTTETTAAFLWDANGNLVAWPSNAKEDSPIGDSQDLLRPGRDDRWIEITARRELRPGLQNPPWAVATTTRGKKLLSVYLERTSEAHHGQRTGYSISPDGQWLVTTGSDATVRLWPLEAEELVKLVCSRLPRNLTPQEWSQLQVDDGPQRKTCDSLP